MKNLKTYFITGTSRGIGFELVRQLADGGHHIYATTQHPENAVKLTELQQKHRDQIKILPLDIEKDASVTALQQALESVGDELVIDTVINNSGVYLDRADSFELVDLEHVRRTFEINTIGTMRVTRALMPFLNRSTAPKLINISSLMGSIEDNTSGGYYGYRISKTAINMFTKSFAMDYPHITALALHPGWVQTDMGGTSAPTSVEESVSGLIKVIDAAGLKRTGQFIDFEGDLLPW